MSANLPEKRSADEKYCHACSKAINHLAQSCPSCGAPQSLNKSIVAGENQGAGQPIPHNFIYCVGCGKPIHNTSHSCPACGALIKPTTLQYGNKNKTTAAIFALFFGGFGVHHFYLGNIGLGVLYLLFFWTFIPALIALVEAIFLFAKSDQEFDRQYNNNN